MYLGFAFTATPEQMKEATRKIAKLQFPKVWPPVASEPHGRYPWRVEEALPEKPEDRVKRIARERAREEREKKRSRVSWAKTMLCARAHDSVQDEWRARRIVLYELTHGSKPDRNTRVLKTLNKDRVNLVQDLCTDLRDGLELV